MKRRSDQLVSTPLLTVEDPGPVELQIVNGSRAIVICDHASNRVPRGLGQLGLSDDALARHIGWDIGAAEVTRRLAPALGAASVLAGYSRLVIDCNREPTDSSSIPMTSGDVVVPGNRGLSTEDRDARRTAIFDP